MEPKQPFFPKNPDFYRPINGSAINGAEHSLDKHGITVNDDTALKNQIMIRLQELEKQNDGLKNIIEQRKNEIADIIAANKKYISILAHDLKSPFSSIYGVLGILKECIHEENNIEEMEEYIDIASSSALNTTNLIENILAWANSQNKETSFYPVRLNLAKLVSREIENSHLSVKLKNITLQHRIKPDMNISADLQMTNTIIRNLINNAIKFTSPNGYIIIKARETGSLIEITVMDNGIGISLKDQQLLFQKGTHELVPVNNNEKGKGLGLLLCKEFIEIHGGTIRVESIPGKGSSFIFTLPKDE